PAASKAAGDPCLDAQCGLELLSQPLQRASRGGGGKARARRNVALHPGLGLAHREAAGEDDFKAVLLVLEARQPDQRPGVARTEGAAGDGGLKRWAGAQEPQRLSDRDPVPSQPGRDLLLGEVEMVREQPDPSRLLDRVEVLSLQVLDQPEDQAPRFLGLVSDLVDSDELRNPGLTAVGRKRDERLETPSEPASLGFHHLASTSLASSR